MAKTKIELVADKDVYADLDSGILVELDKIEWCEWNKRVYRKDDRRNREMRESNALRGVLMPALGRPHPDPDKAEKGIVQGVAGSRRYNSSKEIGRKVMPMVVRPMTDEEAHEATVLENLEREDLEPWEEAQAVKDLMDLYAGNVERVGDRLKRTPSWVAKRVALLELGDDWMSEWQKDPDAEDATMISQFTTSHMEAVARMPKEVRDVLMEWCRKQPVDRLPTAKHFAEEINSRFTRLLHGAPWNLDDESLVPEAGPCVTCRHRSSCQATMFPEFIAEQGKVKKDDRCLSSLCWDKKMEAHVEAETARLREKHGAGLILLTNNWHQADEEDYRHTSSIVLKAKKDGGIPAFHTDGEKAGRLVYIDPKQNALGGRVSSPSGTAPSSGDKQPATLDEKKEKFNRRRKAKRVQNLLTYMNGETHTDDVTGKVEEVAPPIDPLPLFQIVRLVAVFGLPFAKNWLDKADWAAYHKMGDDESVAAVLWPSIRQVLTQRLAYRPSGDVDLLDEDAKQLAELLGLDWDEMWGEVLADMPDPKSWAKEEARLAKEAEEAEQSDADTKEADSEPDDGADDSTSDDNEDSEAVATAASDAAAD